MISKHIKAYLKLDCTDSTAAAIRALNPTLYAFDSEVPEWMYTSLCTLLGVSSGGTGPSTIDGRIVDIYGEDETPGDLTQIRIRPHPAESVLVFGSLQDNEPGAICSEVTLIIQRPKKVVTLGTEELTFTLEQRCRVLLSADLRQKSFKSPGVPSNLTADNGIRGPILMQWQKYESPGHVKELYSTYRADYVLNAGRAIIP